ncbi:hypothetical protein Scep_000480 [Stephania cephalantha]|uniref:Uncharacterized protein n=1 Tax=Stephania cephalantha TaxID=152367 RepID=A0AAP0L9X6_9MAGN
MCSYSRLYTGVPYRDLSTPLGPLGPRHHHTSRSCEADTIAHPDKNFSQLHKKHKKSAKLPQGRLHHRHRSITILHYIVETTSDLKKLPNPTLTNKSSFSFVFHN